MNSLMRGCALLAAGFAIIIATTGRADAGQVVYDLAWSGAALGNNATATGVITLDTSAIPNPANYHGTIPSWASNISVTVTGASSGNGTFTSFVNLYYDTFGATLDLTTQLVGQPIPGGTWGSDHNGNGGDFNLFGFNGAPYGTFYYRLTTNGGNGDPMYLTSFAPELAAVSTPEPGTFALAGMAIACSVGVARRRRAQA